MGSPFFSSLSRCCATLGLWTVLASLASAQQPIALPKPQTEGGKPLMQVLQTRQSAREFSSQKLPPQVLSNLLWAAWGVTRPDDRRTAPSASNRQEIEIYVALSEGLYLYDAPPHALKPVMAADVRGKTGTQPFVGEAPVNLIYVADYAKLGSTKPESKATNAAADTAFIGQNVYLFCASEGLATVFRGMVDREGLAKVMKLRPDQQVTFSQTVGYPRK